MTKEQALQWEANWARPAALAAFFAAVLLIAQIVLLQTVIEDRDNIEAIPDFLLVGRREPGDADRLAGRPGGRGAAGRRCLLLPLPRAPDPRGGSAVLVRLPDHPRPRALRDRARGRRARPGRRRLRLRRRPRRSRGSGATTAPSSCSRTTRAPCVFAINFAGQVVTAFLFVMLPLRARRVGLLSPFMGILGVVTGALLVLQIVPVVPVIIQAFWLGALGSLYHRQLAGRSRPRLGERRGGALADPAAARRRSRRPRTATARADRCSVLRTARSPSRCRSGRARASATQPLDRSPGRTSSTSPNSWRR